MKKNSTRVTKWYLRDQRARVVGQYTLRELAKMRERGSISRFHMISRNRRDWMPVDDVLHEHIHPSVPEPPKPATLPELTLLRPFPVVVLLLVHFLTLGLFSFFWITSMHGRLPKLEPHHPSGWCAVLFMLIPIVNLYWVFLCYPGLAARLNQLRQRYKLPGDIPIPIVVTSCVLYVFSIVVSTTGLVVIYVLSRRGSTIEDARLLFELPPLCTTLLLYLIFVPVLSAIFQQTVNELAAEQQRRLLEQANIDT